VGEPYTEIPQIASLGNMLQRRFVLEVIYHWQGSLVRILLMKQSRHIS